MIAFDRSQAFEFPRGDQAESQTGRAGAAAAADSVGMCGGVGGQLYVDDSRYASDVDAACGYVGGGQYAAALVGE